MGSIQPVLYALIPLAAMGFAALTLWWRMPNAQVKSMIGHFAAGVVFSPGGF